MKKVILSILILLLCLGLAACASQEPTHSISEQSTTVPEQPETLDNTENPENYTENSENTEAPSENSEYQKAILTIAGQRFDVTLYDTPAANALYDMLPLELTFEDFNGIEKIAYMDNELPTDGEPQQFDPDVGDLCLYAPWGNLSIFYNDYSTSNGLISLGHIDSGIEIIGSINENFQAELTKSQ